MWCGCGLRGHGGQIRRSGGCVLRDAVGGLGDLLRGPVVLQTGQLCVQIALVDAVGTAIGPTQDVRDLAHVLQEI